MWRIYIEEDGCRFLFYLLSNVIYVEQLAKYMVIQHQHQGRWKWKWDKWLV